MKRLQLLISSAVFTAVSLAANAETLKQQIQSLSQFDVSHDLDLNQMTLDRQQIFLFKAVEEFLVQFVQVDFQDKLNQKVQLEMPENSRLSAFAIADIKTDSACTSPDRVEALKANLTRTKDFEALIERPELLYRKVKFETPTDRNFANPESTLAVVLNYISKVDFPKMKVASSVSRNRFAQVLRLIYSDQLIYSGQKALETRKELLSLANAGCVKLQNLEESKKLTTETEENLKMLKEIAHQAQVESRQQPSLAFSMLNRDQRRLLSLYMGAYLCRPLHGVSTMIWDATKATNIQILSPWKS
ncbi:MAG: hypothetical protein ACK5P7_05480 [Bdellovibrio sp.]|jgi:hypothetical protein